MFTELVPDVVNPQASVTVTLYVVETFGETVIVSLVSPPGDQR